jgi:hypothetical protein
MRQWNPSVMDNYYSSELSLGAIRKIAGFLSQESKLYFLTHSIVEPTEELIHSTPLGCCWCYKAHHDEVLEVSWANGGGFQTAIYFLHLCCELNKIVLQDIATMSMEHPSRT